MPKEIRLTETSPGAWEMPPRVSGRTRKQDRADIEARRQAFLDSLGPAMGQPFPEPDKLWKWFLGYLGFIGALGLAVTLPMALVKLLLHW
jgi:hypothetical protein